MTPARWFRLGVGVVLVAVPCFVLFSRLDAIWNGHPAYPTTLLLTVAIGLTLAATAFTPWRRDPEPDGPPWEQDDAAHQHEDAAQQHDDAAHPEGDVRNQHGDTDSAPTEAPNTKTSRRRGWWIAGRVVI